MEGIKYAKHIVERMNKKWYEKQAIIDANQSSGFTDTVGNPLLNEMK